MTILHSGLTGYHLQINLVVYIELNPERLISGSPGCWLFSTSRNFHTLDEIGNKKAFQ